MFELSFPSLQAHVSYRRFASYSEPVHLDFGWPVAFTKQEDSIRIMVLLYVR